MDFPSLGVTFFGIPKNCSESLCQALRELARCADGAHNHRTQSGMDLPIKFAVVREPVDRFLSMQNYMSNQPRWDLSTDALLGILERSSLSTYEEASALDVAFVKQSAYDDGGIHWVRMERIPFFWNALCLLFERRLGIVGSHLPHVNGSGRLRPPPTPEEFRRINALYAEDITLYNAVPQTDYDDPYRIFEPTFPPT